MRITRHFLLVICVLIISCLFVNVDAKADEKDFIVKAFHIDLHIQVIKPDALKKLVDELAKTGINTIVMEWEASYPYAKHATLSNELAYTREEVKSFVDYCHSKQIDVIPLQQCFGHVEYILRNKRYSGLKEDMKEISQLCPMKSVADSILFSELFQDLADMHGSKYIHIGGDETYLLGHCKECAKKVEKEGRSKLFVDYMKMITNMVLKMGKIPVMWADIILKYPEAAHELPKETIFVDWNYGWKINYAADINALQQQGFRFWGAPSIRSQPDNWYVTCWEKHLNNQRDFISYARKADYEGIVMTSWSTTGIYGYVWDSMYEVVDMEQMRNTYPLSGFNILISAYAKSLQHKTPIDPRQFVIDYANEQFGFSVADAEKFIEALFSDIELIIEGKPSYSKSIKNVIRINDSARKILYDLKPLKNQREFEHFRLMADLRALYLSFKEIEAVYNSDEYTIGKAGLLLPKLKILINKSASLSKRFARLQKDFLFNSEIEDQNRIRNLPLTILYKRLKKTNNAKP
ncbi:MAG: family 20 glycosylhydrolase [Paludibacter sp.]|nr:family 20 glycosylhydrolase [Paludibacter sp.]